MMCPDTAEQTQPEAGESTGDRLLDAAERLFAEHGFDGTRVRDITAGAGCNIAAVNYHFGGKERLYLAVYRRRFGALREQRIASLDRALGEARGDASLELVVSSFTTAFLEPLVADGQGRHLIGLLSHEMMSPHLPPGVFLDEMVLPVQRALISALRTVCPGLSEEHARLCGLSLVAQLAHLIHSRQLLAGAHGSNPVKEYNLEAIVEHINRFTTGGIRSLLQGGSR